MDREPRPILGEVRECSVAGEYLAVQGCFDRTRREEADAVRLDRAWELELFISGALADDGATFVGNRIAFSFVQVPAGAEARVHR
jgi:hypothetical protein